MSRNLAHTRQPLFYSNGTYMHQKGAERLPVITYWVSLIYSICWKIQTRINHTWGLLDLTCNSVSPGRRGESVWPIREGSARKGSFFLWLQVYERVGISLVEIHEGVGKFVISVFRKAKGANRCNSWPWKSRENFVFLQSSDRKKKCPC